MDPQYCNASYIKNRESVKEKWKNVKIKLGKNGKMKP